MKRKLLGISMVITLVLIVVFSVTLPIGASDPADWPTFHHDTSLSGVSTSQAPNTNAVAWQYNTPSEELLTSPAIVDGKLYIGSEDGNLYALSANSGSLLWKYAADSSQIHSSPAVANGIVYFLDESGVLNALNAITGDVVWSKSLGNGPWDWSSPAVDGGNVFIATSDGWVHSLDADDGDINWKTNIGASPNSMISVANGKVYSGTHNFDNSAPTLVALNENTGEIIWYYNYHLYHSGVTGMINCNGAAVVDGDGDGALEVYFGVYNWGGVGPQAVCLKESTGQEEWTVNINGNSTSTPAVHNSVVFIGSDDGKVYALDAKNSGAKLWSTLLGGEVWGAPAVADGKVFITSTNNYIYALNEKTGVEMWKHTSRIIGSPAVAEGRVFVGSENGIVWAFGPISVAKKADGPGKVEVGTDVSWTLAVKVTNNDPVNSLSDVVVTDRFGADLEIVGLPIVSQGTVTIENTGAKKSPQYRFLWNVGTLAHGVSATMTIQVSTDINPAGKQEYTSPGTHYLNSGATAKGVFLGKQVSATSDPISVEAVEPD